MFRFYQLLARKCDIDHNVKVEGNLTKPVGFFQNHIHVNTMDIHYEYISNTCTYNSIDFISLQACFCTF